MRSVRSFSVVALLVVAACSSGSDDGAEAPATDAATTESAVDTEPVATADQAVDDEPDTVTSDPDADDADDADQGDTDDATDEEGTAEEGGFTIDGPASVTPSCDSLTRGVNEFTLEAGGFTHDVRLFVPTTVSSDPAPVVLNWHGLGSNGPDQASYTGYEDLAEQEGFIVVHATGVDPTGLGGNSWEIAQFDTPERDDLAFADAVIDTVVNDWCADETRVYSTGMSNGGLFTSELVCNRSNRIAAAASVAGTTHVDACDPERAVPYLAFHGTADDVVPFGGGETSILLPPEAVDAIIDEGTAGEFADFAVDNGCDLEPQRTEQTAEVIRYDYTGCDDGIPMTFYEIVGGGHTWPSSPLASADAGLEATGFTFDVDATADAWAFMSEHSL